MRNPNVKSGHSGHYFPRRKAASGFQLIQLMGIILFSLMASALTVDFGFYYAAQNQLQTSADSAALAGVGTLYYSDEVDVPQRLEDVRDDAAYLVSENQANVQLGEQDVVFGFVDPTSKTYDSASFRTASEDPNYSLTGGYNAVWVRASRSQNSPSGPLTTVMARLLGINTMNADATSVALVDQTVSRITNGGVRPIYACEAQFGRTMEDGIPSNNVVRIYGDHVEVDGVQNTAGCPPMGSGNWGFADLRNCDPDAVGTSTMRDWFTKGYPGTVNVGECYSTNPGNFIPAISGELDKLIADETIFPIPLYNSWSGGGSNSKVDVSGFAGFKITGYKSNGSAGSRYIEGRFYKHACKLGCTSGTSGNTTPGGSVVKLRLASK